MSGSADAGLGYGHLVPATRRPRGRPLKVENGGSTAGAPSTPYRLDLTGSQGSNILGRCCFASGPSLAFVIG